jgi:imidazolonepropionase-like amidohydrolase
VLEGYKVAKEIAAHGAGASTFSDWWSYKVEAFDAIPFNAAIMQRKGVLVSLNSDSAELMRHLNQEAAKAVKYGGVTEDEALAMITINPAKQLEIDKWVGSIEAGKVADLTIYDKHPLSNYAKVQKVFIDGELYFDRDQELVERPKKAAEKEGLLERQKQQQRRPGAPGARRPSL